MHALLDFGLTIIMLAQTVEGRRPDHISLGVGLGTCPPSTVEG